MDDCAVLKVTSIIMKWDTRILSHSGVCTLLNKISMPVPHLLSKPNHNSEPAYMLL